MWDRCGSRYLGWHHVGVVFITSRLWCAYKHFHYITFVVSVRHLSGVDDRERSDMFTQFAESNQLCIASSFTKQSQYYTRSHWDLSKRKTTIDFLLISACHVNQRLFDSVWIWNQHRYLNSDHFPVSAAVSSFELSWKLAVTKTPAFTNCSHQSVDRYRDDVHCALVWGKGHQRL